MQGGHEAERRSEASCWWGVQGSSSQDPLVVVTSHCNTSTPSVEGWGVGGGVEEASF